MKKFISMLVILLTVLFFYGPPVNAQGQDTVKIKLSVASNRNIMVDSMTSYAKERNVIMFYTEDSYSYTVIIDNFDHFFDYAGTLIILPVNENSPGILMIGSPPENDNIKSYSVGVTVKDPKKTPVPPQAPPRIILTRVQ
jgi:hypothetical protein